LLERAFPAERAQPWRPWLFNLGWHVVLVLLAVLFTWGAWGRLVQWVGAWFGRPLLRFGAPDDAWGALWRVVLAMLVFDFFSYWWHRAQHRFDLLWVLHQFHHDERHMSAATSMRSQWLSLPFNQVLVQVPTGWVLGLDGGAASLFFAVGLVNAFSHANLRLGLGPLTPLLTGPALHRVHHDRERAIADGNYASVFPVWDMLFGTYRPPSAMTPRPLGVTGVEPTSTLRQVFRQPFEDWKKAWHRRNSRG
jgi:sterol desaturase/sphingolipid hydroxylase (fatty acid hydroxylase superfamily)